MKRTMISILLLASIAISICTYYATIDHRFESVQTFANFPVPTSAQLKTEAQSTQHYHWKSASITGLPLSYQIVLYKEGWSKVKTAPAQVTYEKDGTQVEVAFDLKEIQLQQR